MSGYDPDAAPTPLVPRCSRSWPLDDPSEYDAANGIVHHCDRDEGHDNGHLCVCGHSIDDEETT